MVRGIIIIHLVSLCLGEEITQSVSVKTGDQLAVLEFEGWAVSEPLTEFLTEEFRQTVSDLKIFQVQDRGITNQIKIFKPRKKDYWSCWSKECAIDLGRKLGVNYVIAGNIQKKGDDTFIINGRLFSVDMETMLDEFAMATSGITDSLLLEMKKMAYNVSGLPIPDTLSVGSGISQVATTDDIKRKRQWIQLPPIPSKIKALMMSTAIPGSGQIWAERKYPGYGFMGTEATLGMAAFIAYYQYDKAWGGFQDTYNSYQNDTDPHNLLELRPQIIQYAADTRKYNAFMKNIRSVGLSIWAVNMVHAYLVAPSDDFFDGEYFFDIEYKPDVNQVQFNINF
jgi:TolB-like protein